MNLSEYLAYRKIKQEFNPNYAVDYVHLIQNTEEDEQVRVLEGVLSRNRNSTM